MPFFFRAFLISGKADNHEARGIRLIRIAWSEIHKRKFSGVSTIFFSRGDSFKGQWYRLESYSKDRKGTLRDGRYIIIPLEANEAMKHADHSDIDDASRRVASRRHLRHRCRGETISISRGARGKAGLRFIRQLGGLN